MANFILTVSNTGSSNTGSSLGCGWARLQILAGENPAPVTASHGPGIEPCRCGGNTVFDA